MKQDFTDFKNYENCMKGVDGLLHGPMTGVEFEHELSFLSVCLNSSQEGLFGLASLGNVKREFHKPDNLSGPVYVT